MTSAIDVTSEGAVILGRDVTCDGFIRESAVRVQSHVHTDHMHEFSSSKGFQDIVCSETTHRLLCVMENADLPYRINFRSMAFGSTEEFGDSTVTLLPNDHMLGSVQVVVELDDGFRVGYSGDFTWPMDYPMQVDGLVVDSTYGSPGSTRHFSQGECEEALVSLINRSLSTGPVHLLAHRGTLQRSLQVLAGQLGHPIVATERQVKEANVYSEYGYAIGELISETSELGSQVIESGRYVRLYGTGDRRPPEPGPATSIVCSAYMATPHSPVLERSQRSFSVAISNHADFEGTLDYVAATGAQTVVTDNTRGPHGATLAYELRARLGVVARPSSNLTDRRWGH